MVKEKELINFMSGIVGRLEAIKEVADDEILIRGGGLDTNTLIAISSGIGLVKRDINKKIREVI